MEPKDGPEGEKKERKKSVDRSKPIRAQTNPQVSPTFQEKTPEATPKATYGHIDAIPEEDNHHREQEEITVEPKILPPSLDIVVPIVELEEKREDKLRKSFQGSPNHSRKELTEAISHKLNLFMRKKEKSKPTLIEVKE